MLLVSGAHMRLKRAFRQRIVSSVMSSGLCPACGGFSAHTFRAAALSETPSVFDALPGIKEPGTCGMGQFEFS